MFPDTTKSLLFKTGDCIRLPLPVLITDIKELQNHIPTTLYKLKSRLSSTWEEIN